MKSLTNIMEDMSALYDEVWQDRCEIKKASELANISGKYLKAYQLDLAREIFLSGKAGLKLGAEAPLLLQEESPPPH